MENIYILPTYNDQYDDYAFGSWLKRNVGNIAQTIGGAALIATGIGAGAGAGMLASGVGGFGNSAVQADAEKQAEEDALLAKKNVLAQNRMNALNVTGTGTPTFKKGGHLPEGRATLAEAKEYIQAFPDEMKMGEEVEYEHTGNKKLAQRIAADHVKDYLKMTGTPGYYSAMKQAGISDELNKMEKGGYFEYKNGGIYIKPEKRGSFTAWAKKHGMSVQQAASKVMANKENYSSSVVKKANFAKNASKWHNLGGKLENIPDLSFFPEGGSISPTPIHPITYGKSRSFSGSNYIFDPRTIADNNYFMPENVIRKGSSVAGTPKVLPTMVGSSPGFVDYTERTDLPPAGYRTVNGADTTYTYRKEFKTPAGRDTVAYVPGTRVDVANAMHRINNPSGRDATNPTTGVPSADWHTKDRAVSAYYEAIGQKRPDLFAAGGEMLTEYKTGGTHKENPLGGIPIGGKARVEEGEYRFTDPDTGESYIFSNRI